MILSIVHHNQILFKILLMQVIYVMIGLFFQHTINVNSVGIPHQMGRRYLVFRYDLKIFFLHGLFVGVELYLRFICLLCYKINVQLDSLFINVPPPLLILHWPYSKCTSAHPPVLIWCQHFLFKFNNIRENCITHYTCIA